MWGRKGQRSSPQCRCRHPEPRKKTSENTMHGVPADASAPPTSRRCRRRVRHMRRATERYQAPALHCTPHRARTAHSNSQRYYALRSSCCATGDAQWDDAQRDDEAGAAMLRRVNGIDSTGAHEGAHPQRVPSPRPVRHRFAKAPAKSACSAGAQRNDDNSDAARSQELPAARAPAVRERPRSRLSLQSSTGRSVRPRGAQHHPDGQPDAGAKTTFWTSTSTIAGERPAAHPLHAPHADAARTPGTAGRQWRRWAPPDLPRLTKNITYRSTETIRAYNQYIYQSIPAYTNLTGSTSQHTQPPFSHPRDSVTHRPPTAVPPE